MSFYSPLRYPGGKGKLTDYIKLIFEKNELLDGHYVEPYAGGSSIAINLLIHNYASCIHLNDLNSSVYAFWYSVINNAEELCKLITDTKVNMDEWYKQKLIQDNSENHSLLELGFSTFFLNRTNRSGIILAGVIGGKNQTGNWKIDARYNKPELCRRIEAIALYQSRIRLYNLDAKVLINEILPTIPNKSLIYLDPPYYVKGQGLYENHYVHNDHIEIAKLVKDKISQPWIVSYDHVPEIIGMYGDSASLTYGINYSAANRYEGAEVMFFSENLIIPDTKNPANLKTA